MVSLAAAGLLAVVLAILGATLPVPMVALGPGPTYDTLGEVNGIPVVSVEGLSTYPTSGHLNMTTVAVSDRLTLFSVLAMWAASERQVVPRDQVFPPQLSDEQVQRENSQQFLASEVNAQIAALGVLGIPTRVVVTEIVPGSPADGTLQAGDEVVAVSGRPVDSIDALTAALADTKPGQTVTVSYRRAGRLNSVDVALAASPDRPHGLLGVRPGVEPRDGDVTIQLGDIGGPSAGLMFALAVVDRLTPGELTGGRFIAGTGAITPDGVVQPIGGITFKMAAARAAGAEVFLVPAENCAEATKNAPDGLLLVRVANLREAIAALEGLDSGEHPVSC